MTTDEKRQVETAAMQPAEPNHSTAEPGDADSSPAVSPAESSDSSAVPAATQAEPGSTVQETHAEPEPAVTVTETATPAQTSPEPTLSVAEMMAASQPETTEPAVSAEAPTATEAPVSAEAPAAPEAPAPAAAEAAKAPASDAASAAAQTPPMPETPVVAEAAAAVEAPTMEAADISNEAATDVAAAGSPASERPADRIRQKLGGSSEERPRGSEDIKALRPEIPTNAEPVTIPGSDDLDTDLEAEISAALGSATVPTDTTPPPPVESFGDAATTPAPKARPPEEVGPGSKITGTVQHIHGDDVFLNAGLLNDVVVSLKQFPADKPPEVGASIKVVIELEDEDGLFRARLPQARSKSGGNWDGLAVGQVVDAMVTATNKGGLQVTVSNIKGFLPASQVDLGFVDNLEKYVGQKLSVQITEVKPRKKNLVVSRRALLQAERESTQADFLQSLEPGQDFTGTVKTLKNYGAFVNLGPIDGFLHVGEISWSRINHPNEVLKEGQEVQVRVLKFDKEKNRISLGMKQLVQNPWHGLSERYPSERVVSGKVTRTADFGAFVELEPGVEGLVHISELAWRRVGSVGEVLKVGDEKDFKVLEVDQKRKRVSLSLKALEQKPEAMQKAEAAAEEEEARPPRRANVDLRGGMGGQSGGSGLFGNPSDFS